LKQPFVDDDDADDADDADDDTPGRVVLGVIPNMRSYFVMPAMEIQVDYKRNVTRIVQDRPGSSGIFRPRLQWKITDLFGLIAAQQMTSDGEIILTVFKTADVVGDATDAGDGGAVDVIRSVLSGLAEGAEHDVIVVGAQINGCAASRRCRRRWRHQLGVARQRGRFGFDAGGVCDVCDVVASVGVHRWRQRYLRRPRRRRRIVEAEHVALQTLELIGHFRSAAAICSIPINRVGLIQLKGHFPDFQPEFTR